MNTEPKKNEAETEIEDSLFFEEVKSDDIERIEQ